MPPSYFYHLKFELCPYSPPEPQSEKSVKLGRTEKEKKRESARELFLPEEGSDIFETGNWPDHTRAPGLGRERVELEREEDTPSRRSKRKTAPGQEGRAASGVKRIGNEGEHTQDQKNTKDLPIRTPTHAEEASTPNLLQATRDYRFAPLRIESLDMPPQTPNRPDMHTRNASSPGTGIAGLVPSEIGSGRGVTKARFEPVAGGGGVGGLNMKSTEVGWGIVHLYRDGEETWNTGMGVELYSAEDSVEAEAEAEVEDRDPEAEYTTVCIPAVPSYLTASDLLGFVGERTRDEVSHFRMVMTGRLNRYLVLMKFRRGSDARRWRKEWDGKVFSGMEPETCHILFIKSITFQVPPSSTTTPSNNAASTSYPALTSDPFTTSHLKPLPPPTPSLVELPTCPVCLERMDDTTGLLTILCQHVFHCACLQKWRGSGCPVCRHTNPPPSIGLTPFGSGEASLCSVCDTTEDLWICLICGNVGCGRYKGGHAKEHWKEVAHNFALEIETQHVWDYAEDIWVHRLIRGKGDGKVLEVGDSHRRGGEDEDMVPRAKLESIGMDYSNLLTKQLESQRVYFEDLVGKAVSKASSAAASAASASQQAGEALSRVEILEGENKHLKSDLVTLERDLSRERKKSSKSSEMARGFGKQLVEERKVSEGLMERVGFLNKGMLEMSAEMGKLKGENEELREVNRDLLFSVSASQKIAEMEDGGEVEKGELEEGTLGVVEKKRRGRKK